MSLDIDVYNTTVKPVIKMTTHGDCPCYYEIGWVLNELVKYISIFLYYFILTN